jgi:hypothetical protein
MLDTTCTPPVHPSSFSLKWGERAARYFLDALGASAWDEAYGQTLGYRWKGEDTLTWGNADEWIVIKWLAQRFVLQEQADMSFVANASDTAASLFFTQEQVDLSVFAEQEANLWAIVYEARIAKLGSIYTFRNSDEVIEFLINNKIFSVLWEAWPVLQEFFGSDISVALEVVNDPETTHTKQLFGYISAMSLSPDEAFERLNAFDEAWFLKQFVLTGGLLNFNLE